MNVDLARFNTQNIGYDLRECGLIALSFPKIQSGGIRMVRQNQRIIRCDACDHPFACDVYSRSVQVTAPA
jgi:hypothetical protein